MRILLGNAFLRIDHQNSHISLFDRLHGLDHGEFLDRFKHLAALANACGVDDLVMLVTTLQINLD